MSDKNAIDFSTVLAAAVHDMKSSLNLLRQSIDGINRQISTDNVELNAHMSAAHYESARLNTGLVQLLTLYRAEIGNLPITEDECFIDDLLDNIKIAHDDYLAHKNMSLEIRQADGLVRYLDRELVTLLLNDILVNAMRYGKGKLLINAFEQGDWLVIEVCDDGDGYPKSMLRAQEADMQQFRISEGRTGLGLFFAKAIAQGHRRGERKGNISLANGGLLGGSVFTLTLP